MKILHTMLRVGDLDRSIKFYQDVLGMRLLRTSENPEYKYTLAFLGYEDGESAAEIELTYNWGVTEYDLGNAYGHIAASVQRSGSYSGGPICRAYSSCGGWLYHLAHQSAGKCIHDDLHRRKRGSGAALRSA